MGERRWIAGILLLYFLLGFGYSILMPMWEGPDERAHYGVILSIARTGEVPSQDENYEAYQRPLYYWLASWQVRWLDGIRPEWARNTLPPTFTLDYGVPKYDWNTGNYTFLLAPLSVRWLGLVFGALTLLLVHAGIRKLVPEDPVLARATIALMAGIPQFIHITSSVNNDVIAILAGGILFWLLCFACRSSLSWQQAGLALGAAVLLPLVTKLTLLPLAVSLMLAVLWQTRSVWRARLGRSLILGAGTGAILLLALWIFSPEILQSNIVDFQYRLGTWNLENLDFGLISLTARYVWSFWGLVGWLSTGIPQVAAALLTVWGMIGIGIAIKSIIRRDSRRSYSPAVSLLLILCTAALLTGFLMVVRNIFVSTQFQGRFLFPTLAPIALMIVFGWEKLLKNKAHLLPISLVILFLVLNLHLWLTGVIPVYFQPFLDS